MTGKMACICLLAGTVLARLGVGAIEAQEAKETPSRSRAVGLPQTPAQSAGSGPSSGQSAFGETSPTGGFVTIFFTGNELGAMQPCGCSGGQLGGLDRRHAVLSSVGPENRLIIDTGFLVPESTEQNLIKFNVIVQAFSQLGYDLVNLTEQDMLIARQAGLFDGLGSVFNIITANCPDDANLPAKFTRRFTLNASAVDVTVAVAGTDEQIFAVARMLPAEDTNSSGTVNIVIVSRTDAVSVAAETRAFDCIISPPQSDEPMLIGDANARPLVISVGRLGKYVGKIRVALTAASQKPQLSFSAIPVAENLPQHQPLVELYKDYQRLVKETNLLERYPKFVLPDNLEYVGSRSCKLCHDYEYEKWSTSQPLILHSGDTPSQGRHANAFATLEKVGSDYDPECVICHVVGMQYQSGFISPAKTPELKDIGCENCHGPGSEHLRSLGAVETSGPISTCTDCHTSEHSAEYAGNEKQYFEKIIHWREPVSLVRVKEPNRAP
jgi:hypothetical protein